MGRRKLKIKRLETVKARQVKYSKRKFGVLKKAKELAALCGVDVGLVMFSPTGQPSHYVGHDKDLSTILNKFAKLSFEVKEKRKAYTLQKLFKKVNAKEDSDDDLENHGLDRGEELQLRNQQLKEVKQKLVEKRKILRDWKNPYSVESLEQIKIMEDHLNATLHKLNDIKIQLREQHNKA